MNNIALLIGDTIIYWNQIIVVLGLLAGFVFAFVLRPFTKVNRNAVIVWFIFAFFFSVFFSRMMYYYCHTEQAFAMSEVFKNFFDDKYSVVGLVFGTLLAAVFLKLIRIVNNIGKLLDTTFPGVVLALALIRLSYYFSETYHSRIAINNEIWQRLPFAVRTVDEAGNTFFVFAPFLVSFIILFLTVFVLTLCVRRIVKRSGDLFLLTFVFLALSEMVLESTRYDALKLHLMFLTSLNKYVSFISFSMLIFGICMLILFLFNYRKAVKATGKRNNILSLILFVVSFLCFGVCEYLVQRYTAQESLFHWVQAAVAVIMAISTLMVIGQKNTRREKVQKKEKRVPAAQPEPINLNSES